jgi:hypothetical protein
MGVTLLAQATKIDFERDEVGKPPKGFSFALTGQGKPGVSGKGDQGAGIVWRYRDQNNCRFRRTKKSVTAFAKSCRSPSGPDALTTDRKSVNPTR